MRPCEDSAALAGTRRTINLQQTGCPTQQLIMVLVLHRPLLELLLGEAGQCSPKIQDRFPLIHRMKGQQVFRGMRQFIEVTACIVISIVVPVVESDAVIDGIVVYLPV
jgi:hypothetical protein